MATARAHPAAPHRPRHYYTTMSLPQPLHCCGDSDIQFVVEPLELEDFRFKGKEAMMEQQTSHSISVQKELRVCHLKHALKNWASLCLRHPGRSRISSL